MSAYPVTPGYKMIVPIRRRPTATREELIANWFANHMPTLVKSQALAALQGQPHCSRYIVTLFDANAQGQYPWDGVAQLQWPMFIPTPEVAHGTKPMDTFQEKAEPYSPWMTVEHVVLDEPGRLSTRQNVMNDPMPYTRSGFFKVTFLVKMQAGADGAALHKHWLEVHGPAMAALMKEVGGFRYTVALSCEPQKDPYAGVAELFFPDAAAWGRFAAGIKPDGMEQWMDGAGTVMMTSGTEMVGIPG